MFINRVRQRSLYSKWILKVLWRNSSHAASCGDCPSVFGGHGGQSVTVIAGQVSCAVVVGGGRSCAEVSLSCVRMPEYEASGSNSIMTGRLPWASEGSSFCLC